MRDSTEFHPRTAKITRPHSGSACIDLFKRQSTMTDIPTIADLLNADETCSYLAKDLDISSRIHGAEWTHTERQRNLDDRSALLRVRGLLMEAAKEGIDD